MNDYPDELEPYLFEVPGIGKCFLLSDKDADYKNGRYYVLKINRKPLFVFDTSPFDDWIFSNLAKGIGKPIMASKFLQELPIKGI